MTKYTVTPAALHAALRFAGKLWTDRSLAQRGWGEVNPTRELVALATLRK